MQECPAARTLCGEALAQSLREARARTKAWTFDLTDGQWRVPQQPGVNLPAWELAHVVWFGEFWVVRGPHELDDDGLVHARRPPRISGPDALFDSARLPHASRWSVPLPSRAELDDQLDAQLALLLAALETSDGSDASRYFHRLALFHEDMHAEAFAWMRATLGYPAPDGLMLARMTGASSLQVAAGRMQVGWPPGRAGFSFDNEREAHVVDLAAYEIDATPVSAGDFEQFVNEGGYDEGSWWPGEAGRWRAEQARNHPARWRRSVNGWETRWFDRWLPLDPQQPAIHLTAWEAEAYARWRGRRLPTAAEWEHAASANRALNWGGGVWEWTADAFQPYPGFAPGPYRDYSAPWFGNHRELRGGAFATHARMHDARYRNFFQPNRNDIFAGFRTARTI
jgi:ergothioneine biosynthesis protein EgtB